MDLLHFTFFVVIIEVLLFSSDGQVCFKKYVKRKNRCKGPIRKGKYETASACCSSRKGVGFAIAREKRGKNLYLCTPCDAFGGKIPTKKERQRLGQKIKERKPKHHVSGDWSSWGACSVTCGAGWRSRVRICDTCIGTDPRNMQVQPCIQRHYCPVHGNWGPWYPWQDCSASCDGGKQIRERHCNYPPPSYGGKNCAGDAQKERECNTQECPVDGNWGPWARFSKCSVTCGKGSMIRTRKCDNPEPTAGGKTCQGSRYEQRKCTNRLCPIHGGWSLWGEWSSCSVTCGTGVRHRNRKCDSPKPRFGGKPCKGPTKDDQKCKSSRPCPVNGNWSPWTSYAACNAERCSGKTGHRIRSRTCSNPRPSFGGKFCKGSGFLSVECMNDEGCPVNGEWCDWSEWSPCIVTCKSRFNHLAYERRERTCSCPYPKNGGKTCNTEDASGFEVRECEGVSWCDFTPIDNNNGTRTKTGCRVETGGSGDGSDVSCDQEGDADEPNEDLDEETEGSA